jgi:signal transduction histidine kinase
MAMRIATAQENNVSHRAEFLSDFLAFTGHELRNHVAILSMASRRLAYVIENRLNLEDQQEAVKRIEQSTRLLQQSALHYLMMAEMNHPDFKPDIVLVDPVRDIIDPLLYVYADLLATNQQECKIEVGYPGILIWADRSLITSVFENLLSNAIKYGNANSSILLRIEDRGVENEISIFNAGVGITPELLDGLFAPFSRGQDVSHISGHGVGLYLVRRIIEAHGGHCWVESQFGHWTRFTFTLPQRGR